MLCLSKASWESRRGEVHKLRKVQITTTLQKFLCFCCCEKCCQQTCCNKRESVKVPADMGGVELGFTAACLAIEEVAKVDPSVSALMDREILMCRFDHIFREPEQHHSTCRNCTNLAGHSQHAVGHRILSKRCEFLESP